ncbi:MAG: hypothetical protein H7Y89_18735 [Steroidobacteraceae bacterium]|nr:hypothetical protein [Steroidobacteraceae bacterium]
MIVWREKLIAMAVHFVVTAVLAGAAAALIFFVWFPAPFHTMIGGTDLFLLVIGCDLALGPLLSLVIYNSRKSRRELITDYTIVGAIQLAALVYGVYIVAGTRPVAVAFLKDRIEIVTARDVEPDELAAAKDPQYASLPWTGPRHVNVVVPAAEEQDALFKSLAGKEEMTRPRFYLPYETALPEILKRAGTLEQLVAKKPDAKNDIDAAVTDAKLPKDKLRWLPVRHRKGFWTVLIDIDTGRPVEYFALDPY